jgi:hypothetical protein
VDAARLPLVKGKRSGAGNGSIDVDQTLKSYYDDDRPSFTAWYGPRMSITRQKKPHWITIPDTHATRFWTEGM